MRENRNSIAELNVRQGLEKRTKAYHTGGSGLRGEVCSLRN